MKKRVLFVCTRNSARSQVAEGCLNARYGAVTRASPPAPDPAD